MSKKTAWASIIVGRPSVCLYTLLTLLCYPTAMLTRINDLAILSHRHIMHMTWVCNDLAEGNGTTGILQINGKGLQTMTLAANITDT